MLSKPNACGGLSGQLLAVFLMLKTFLVRTFLVAESFLVTTSTKHCVRICRVEFVQIAIDHKPLNLGQGLPDDLVPKFVIDALNEVVKEHTNPLHQYTRGFVRLLVLARWQRMHLVVFAVD